MKANIKRELFGEVYNTYATNINSPLKIKLTWASKPFLPNPSVMQEFVWRPGTETEISQCMSNSQNKDLFKHCLVSFLATLRCFNEHERFYVIYPTALKCLHCCLFEDSATKSTFYNENSKRDSYTSKIT